ncbi:MAG: hypothetical protein J7M34_15025 [Anaerolineae bacterium]|nr:hypothetical protein [Anaerolineae bacterium]
MVRPDTIETLRKRKKGNLRQLAQELGFPASFAATLSDVLRERHENVSLATENRLRVALGLEPIKTYEVEACPDCGGIHVGRCYGKGPNSLVVVIDPHTERIVRRHPQKRRRRRASISIPIELRDQLNEARKAAGKSWEEFLENLLYSPSEDAP